MRKDFIRLARLCAILGSIIAAVGCVGAGQAGGSVDAVLILGFDSSVSVKALSPASPLASPQSAPRSKSMAIVPEGLAIASIDLELSGPGGARVQKKTEGSRPVEIELAPGPWTILAKGFNADGIELVEGSLSLRLEPSERLSRTLVLGPVPGRGSISLAWSLSGELGGALTVAGSLEGPSGERRSIDSPFDRPGGSPLSIGDLPSGGWKLSLSLLRDGTAVCGLAEGILVAAGMTTRASVVFSPPEARMSMSFIVPDYGSTSLSLAPSVRRAALAQEVAFKADCPGSASWFAEGSPLAETGPRLRFAPRTNAASTRVDCVYADPNGSSPPRSGSARLVSRERQELGSLKWSEVHIRSEQDEASQALARGLSDCRDLAWSPSGSLVAAAGRSSNCVSVFEAAEAGSLFPLAAVGGSEEPGLAAPSRLRFASETCILALSESAGAVYAISIEGSGDETDLSLAGSFADEALRGAKDLALAPAGPGDRAAQAYVAAADADAVVMLELGEGGVPSSARVAAARGSGDMAGFSRPNCVALDDTGTLLAVGTAGDDAIYVFDRNPASGELSLRQRIDKSSFPAGAPLSDPCALAFGMDSSSLFALSYYGKSIARLDRDGATGAFAPVAGARSGTGDVRGFSTPRSLGLYPGGRLAAIAGSGADDGLALFATSASGGLAYLGSMLPPQGDAVPQRPMALAFAPDGGRLALASDGAISIFAVSAVN
jgi:hypothetical protein